jgi:hypothetical protein
VTEVETDCPLPKQIRADNLFDAGHSAKYRPLPSLPINSHSIDFPYSLAILKRIVAPGSGGCNFSPMLPDGNQGRAAGAGRHGPKSTSLCALKYH